MVDYMPELFSLHPKGNCLTARKEPIIFTITLGFTGKYTGNTLSAKYGIQQVYCSSHLSGDQESAD